MNLQYIDIHSHLNLQPLYENREAVLAKMREMGVGTITVGTDLETSQMAIEIADANPGLCFATVGFHPTNESAPTESQLMELEKLAAHEHVVAIGETGLDYFRDQSPETKKIQTEIFKKHIDLATKLGKPLMLHVRSSKGTDDAYYDALEILKNFPPLRRGGGIPRSSRNDGGVNEVTDPISIDTITPPPQAVPLPFAGEEMLRANFHFFSGSKQCMLDIVAAGYTVSVDGPITFSSDYDDMICACPIESLMVETDAPFAAPVPYRGKPAEPWMVVEVAKKIAELKGLDLETVRVQMLENTKNFFRIGK